MKTNKWLAGVLAVAFASALCAAAADGDAGGAAKPEKKQRPEKKGEGAAAVQLQEVALTGKVMKEEIKKEGAEKAVVRYVLVDANGNKTVLPSVKPAAEGAAPAIKIEDFVDSQVTVTGMGSTKQADGKSVTKLQSITKIDKVVQ